MCKMTAKFPLLLRATLKAKWMSMFDKGVPFLVVFFVQIETSTSSFLSLPKRKEWTNQKGEIPSENDPHVSLELPLFFQLGRANFLALAR